MLAPALGRHAGGGALDDLQQGLLNTLARNVAGDRGIVALAGNLVDFIDVDDALLGPLDVVVGILQKRQDDVLDILAHVAGLGQAGGIGDGKRYVQEARQGLGQQGLTAAGRPNQQNIAFLNFDIAISKARIQALVMVVDGHRQNPLGRLLLDDVFVQLRFDFLGHEQVLKRVCLFFALLFDDLAAELDALVADVDRRAGNQLVDLFLALPAERTEQIVVVILFIRHFCSPRYPHPRRDRPGW